MRTTVPLVITFIVGIIMVGEYFIPAWQYRVLTQTILTFGIIIAASAFVLGLINLCQVHIPKIINRNPDWGHNLILIIALIVTAGAGAFGGLDRNDSGQFFRWIYDFLYIPLNATMFALLAFYIASAAFRAFRARNLEATVLLTAACIVMFARVPIGESFWALFSDGNELGHFQNWIMDVPNVAARRAIFIGAALGAVATGLRIILGIERNHLGGE